MISDYVAQDNRHGMPKISGGTGCQEQLPEWSHGHLVPNFQFECGSYQGRH